MDLNTLLETTVVGLGYELVDVELSPRGRTIRVFMCRGEWYLVRRTTLTEPYINMACVRGIGVALTSMICVR